MSATSAIVAENYHLKWNSHLSFLHLSLVTLFRNERFADVMLISSHPDSIGGPGIPAHKIILCSCSQFFSSIFTNQPAAQNNNLIHVILPPELSYRTIRTLVQYMYSGESTVCNDILKEVLRGGEILKIRGLCKSQNKASSQDDYSNDIYFGKSPSQSPIPASSECNNTKNNSSFFRDGASVVRSTENILLIDKSINNSIRMDSETATNPIIGKGLLTIKKNIAIDPDDSLNSKLLMPLTDSENCIDFDQTKILQTSEDVSNKKPSIPSTSGFSKQKRKSSDSINNEEIIKQCNSRIKSKSQKNYHPSTSTALMAKRKLQDSLETMPFVTNTNNELTDKIIQDEEIGILAVIKEEPMDCIQDINSSFCSNGQPVTKLDEIKTENLNVYHENSIDDPADNRGNEFYSDVDDNDVRNSDEIEDHFTPLVCELCNEKFTFPRDWVRHIETHMDNTTTLVQKKKQKKFEKCTNKKSDDDFIVALKCDLCSTFYDSPAEWVRHIQSKHTENELAAVNSKHEENKVTPNKIFNPNKNNPFEEFLKKSCDICGKFFPTYASMIIHLRTHSSNKT